MGYFDARDRIKAASLELDGAISEKYLKQHVGTLVFQYCTLDKNGVVRAVDDSIRCKFAHKHIATLIQYVLNEMAMRGSNSDVAQLL